MRPRVARSSLTVEAHKTCTPVTEKVRCRSCGVGLPAGQCILPPASFYICSYCKGDPFWGQDGYLLEIIEEELAIVRKRHSALVAHQHILSMVLRAPGPELAAYRRRECRQYFGLAGA